MTKKSSYQLGMPADFRIGEKIPLKGCWFSVAHVETGVLILALEGFTKAGLDALARLKVKFEEEQQEELKEVSKDMLPTKYEKS